MSVCVAYIAVFMAFADYFALHKEHREALHRRCSEPRLCSLLRKCPACSVHGRPTQHAAFTHPTVLQTDNNGNRNFKLSLVDALTEDQLLERRVRLFKEAEDARLKEIEEAESKVRAEVRATLLFVPTSGLQCSQAACLDWHARSCWCSLVVCFLGGGRRDMGSYGGLTLRMQRLRCACQCAHTCRAHQ